MAKDLGEPMAMVSACKEIGKMLGYYDKSSKDELSGQCRYEFLEQLKKLSGEKLAAIILREKIPA